MNEQHLDCNIILDLLPLSLDHMVSKETDNIIQEHLATCENCRITYEEMRLSLDCFSNEHSSTKRKHRFKRKSRIRVIILSYVFFLLLILSLCMIDILFL